MIATAILHGLFPPKAEHLPACHRAGERGWLERIVIDGLVVFSLSRWGVAALELGVPLGEAKEEAN